MEQVLKRLMRVASLGLCSAGVIGSALAQDFPSKPIRLVGPFPPGGSTDIFARVIAQKAAEHLGQQVVIDNRPGGGTNIATQHVIGSAPDGYTTYIAVSTLAVQAARPDAPFDLQRDLAPVTALAQGVLVFAVPSALPVKTIKEFIAYAKARPGKLNYGSASGVGGLTHLAFELFNLRAGLNLQHVPYKGGAPALQALANADVHLAMDQIAAIQALAGKIQPIALATATPRPSVPGLPGMSEAGVANYDVSFWYGIFAPARTPAPVLGKLAIAYRAALRSSEGRDLMRKFGLEDAADADLRELARRDIQNWSQVIREAQIKFE